MSFSVPHGWRYDGQVYDLIGMLEEQRPVVKQMVMDKYTRFITNICEDWLNSRALHHPYEPITCSPISYAEQLWINRTAKMRTSRMNDFDVDVDFDACVYPIHRDLNVGILLVGEVAWAEWFKGLPGIETYTFHDSERPKDITVQQWAERKEIWLKALLNNKTFRDSGFQISLAPGWGPDIFADDSFKSQVVAISRAPEQRARKWARLITNIEYCRDKFGDTRSSQQILRQHRIAEEWLETEEGQARLAEKFEHILSRLPIITEELLGTDP